LALYYFQFVNLIQVNEANAVAAKLSISGAAKWSMNSVIAVSWTGAIFFYTVDLLIPSEYTKIKLFLAGAKFLTAAPIRIVEWTLNKIIDRCR
jgi:hypothetical protein